jgi:hypothetical protein
MEARVTDDLLAEGTPNAPDPPPKPKAEVELALAGFPAWFPKIEPAKKKAKPNQTT